MVVLDSNSKYSYKKQIQAESGYLNNLITKLNWEGIVTNDYWLLKLQTLIRNLCGFMLLFLFLGRQNCDETCITLNKFFISI